MPFLLAAPELEVTCMTTPDRLTVRLICTTNNDVSAVSCSYDGSAGVPCE